MLQYEPMRVNYSHEKGGTVQIQTQTTPDEIINAHIKRGRGAEGQLFSSKDVRAEFYDCGSTITRPTTGLRR